MISKYPALEWVVIALALGMFICYHIVFAVRAGLFFGLFRRAAAANYGITGKGKVARVAFTHLVSTKKGGILGVQQNRNTMMGASFQASIAALFFNTLLDILLSPSKLQALQTFAVVDPLLEAPDEPADDPTSVRIGQVSALVVVIMNLAVILFSMLLFAVVVRLSIHTGYYYKSCGHENALITVEDAVKLTLETQVVYTMGQRLVFFFPILAMWFLGPTAMLVTSVIVTSAVVLLDQWNPENPASHIAEVLEYRPVPAVETTVPTTSS